MFPTRTTTTTGTLRVPPAAKAPTTFGWATAPLRHAEPAPTAVPSPAAEPTPAPALAAVPSPAGEALPLAAAPAGAPAQAAAAASAPPAGRHLAPYAPAAVPAPTGEAQPAEPARPAEPTAAPVYREDTARASNDSAAPDAPADPIPGAAHSAPLGAPASAGAVQRPSAAPARHSTAAEPQAAPAADPAPAEPETGAATGRAVATAPDASPPAQDVRATGPVSGAGLRAVSATDTSPRAPERQTVSTAARAEGVRATGPVPGSPLRAAEPQTAPAAWSAPLGTRTPPPSAGPQPADGGDASRPVTTSGRAGAPASGPAVRTVAPAAPRSAEPQGGAGPRSAAGPAGEAGVPAARGHASDGVGTIFDIPHPHEEPVDAANSGVPGPGVAEIVARAVARGMAEEDDTQDLPKVTAPHRGTAVTEVPVNLPFRATTPALPESTRTGRATASPRPAPGRRVPRGDDRLREHRGPVLPGWVGVAVGGLALAGCAAVLWRAGVVPAPLVAAFGAAPRAYQGLRATHWPPLAFLGIVALVALGGLGRARTGHAWVLTLFGRYRGTVRRTGLTWVSPLLLRRRVDVRLRHWRSDPMPAVDSGGLALQVVVQVVWQVKDTARATLAVADHTEYLAEQVESAMARVLSQLPADAFHEDAPTLRDAEAVGDALTRMLAAETEAVGIEVYSAQPTRIEYAPEVAEAMRRRRVAAIDAKHRDTVLTSVVDAVDDTVHRLTSRGLVELDDYERKALVKDLTVAFCTGRTE